MNDAPSTVQRVVGVDPASRGVGFAILEGPSELIDWGVKGCPENTNAQCLAMLDALVAQYAPDILVLEDPDAKDCRRGKRVRELLRTIIQAADRLGLGVKRVSHAELGAAFPEDGPMTKVRIAETVTTRFPELWPQLPAERKPWESEAYAMAIFDAVALAMAFFASQGNTAPPGDITPPAEPPSPH